MKFLYPHFLYFLPVALVPILIYLFDRIKRKPIVFSSLELIQEVVREEKKRVKINFFLRQIIKSIILLLLILSFAQPVIKAPLKDFVAIIDPTYSMKDFNLFEIINILKNNMIEKIYVGRNEYKDEIFYEKEKDVVKILNEKAKGNILLVTDGQKINFEKIGFLSKNITNLFILLLKHQKENFYFRNVELFPKILVDLSEINIRAKLNTDKESKIMLYINDRIFSELNLKGELNKSFTFERAMLNKGRNIIKLEIVANDFEFDNGIEESFFFIPDIKVYIDKKNTLFYNYTRKLVRSLFDNVKEVENLNEADFAFINSLKINQTIPTYIIPEKEGFKRNILPLKEKNEEIYGEVYSENYPSLNNFRSLKLRNNFEWVGGLYDFSLVLKIGTFPVVYKSGNTFLFTFSFSENIKELSENPFLAVFVYETLSSFYEEKKEKSVAFPSEESVFDFYTKKEFINLIKNVHRNINLKIFELNEIQSKNYNLREILLILCLLLFILEGIN